MGTGAPVLCTSTSRRGLAEARVLAEDVARFHGGAPTVVLVADAARSDLVGEPFDGLILEDLDLDEATGHLLAACRGGAALAAALVPALLETLLGREPGRPVIYLSPQTLLNGALLDLGELARAEGLVLMRRWSHPLPDDGRWPDGDFARAVGTIDPGLVAASGRSEPFLAWWGEQLRAVCADEGSEPELRQPFLDAAVPLFAPHFLEDPRHGLAVWNAHEADRFEVVPLSLRLDGFDPGAPALWSRLGHGQPRVLFSDRPDLGRACAHHAVRLLEVRQERDDEADRFEQLSDGSRLDDRMRRVVREALRAKEEEVPDPFASAGPAAFYRWLAEPEANDRETPLLGRYLKAVHEDRPDLRWHFPRVGTVDGARFREWVEHHGLEEEAIPGGLSRAIAESAWWEAPVGVRIAPPDDLGPGVVLAGYLRAEVGVGEAARLVGRALAQASVETSPVVIGTTPSRQGHAFSVASPVADRRTNIVWANADQLPGFASVVGPAFFVGRYTVGAWVWETERLPESMASSSVLVDEIWVPSAFAEMAIEPAVDRPLRRFPHPVVAPEVDTRFDPRTLGIGDEFVFLFTYDFYSSSARKNPVGLIEAFNRAFPAPGGPTLVLKSVNGGRHLDELEAVRLAAAERPDIRVIDGYLTSGARAALLRRCDCYVSLHRSEGFGLGMAEAMALGRPVVATGYSGNLEYMDEGTALLVPARRVPVGPANAPYEADDFWGDPDLDEAAASLERVAKDPDLARSIGESGRERILRDFGLDRAARFLTTRLGEIEEIRRKGYVSSVAEALAAWV